MKLISLAGICFWRDLRESGVKTRPMGKLERSVAVRAMGAQCLGGGWGSTANQHISSGGLGLVDREVGPLQEGLPIDLRG